MQIVGAVADEVDGRAPAGLATDDKRSARG
jgi:hypothetical protein